MNAPREMPRDAEAQGSSTTATRPVRPLHLQMLGGRSVGKTCFLAGLALLNEQSGNHSFVLPTDDNTKSVFNNLRETLSKGRWPAKTSIATELSFAVIRGKRRVDVRLSDFAGESFLDAMERGDANENAKQIQSLVSDADLLMALLDGAAVDRGAGFGGAPLIQAVFERLAATDPSELEVAVVLTKNDLCIDTPVRTGNDLRSIVESRAPDLSRFLKEQGIETQWAPISVCGPGGTDAAGAPIYAKLTPQGYESIFDQWFRRSRKRRNRILKFVAAAAVLMLIFGIAIINIRQQQVSDQRERISDLSNPVARVTEDVKTGNEPVLRQRYEQEFEKARKDIAESGNAASLSLILKRFDQIPPAHAQLVASGLEQIRANANDRKEQLLYKQIIDCAQLRSGDCVPLIAEYLREFPAGPNAEDLRQMLDDIHQARYLTARGHVKAIPVTSADALRQKTDAIVGFLSDHGQLLPADEKTAITSARDIARQLLEPRQYHCKLVRTSGMDKPRAHGVEILVNGTQIANYDDSGSVREKNWNRDFTVHWRSGQNIQVKLVNYDGRNQDMAFFENNSPLAIVLLASEQTPTRYATTSKWFGTDFTSSRPNFKIQFECEELPPERLQVISDYLLPGDKW